MSRNAFESCARELEERDEQRAQTRLESQMGTCDYCGDERPMSRLIGRNGDYRCPECEAAYQRWLLEEEK